MAKWKCIIGFENYQVSDHGEVVNKNGNRMATTISNSGYERVNLASGKKYQYKTFFVHRLVAIHFIDRLPGKDFVNHKDLNKLNNVASNLEWVSSKGNMDHALQNNPDLKHKMKAAGTKNLIRYNKSTGKKVYCTKTGKVYTSIAEAARDNKIGVGSLEKMLNGVYTNNTSLILKQEPK